MKWFGNIGKQVFMNWMEDANNKELKEYIIKRRSNPWWFNLLMAFLVAFLLIGAFVGWSVVALSYTGDLDINDGGFRDKTVNRFLNIGTSLCTDYGGLIASYYKNESLVYECVDKNILLDGSPLHVVFDEN